MLQLHEQQPVEQSASVPLEKFRTKPKTGSTTEALSHGETNYLQADRFERFVMCLFLSVSLCLRGEKAYFPSSRAFHTSSAFSSFTPREAFNNTTSPSRASRA